MGASAIGMEKGSHLFVVKNYRGIGMYEIVESEEFTVGGDHVWTIRFYRDGIDAFDYQFASLYAFLKSSPMKGDVRYLFDMFVLDQSGKGNDDGFSLIEEFPSSEIPIVTPGNMYGSANFIDRIRLESSDYLKNDCLKFRVTIGVFTFQSQKIPLIKFPESSGMGADFGELLQSEEGADVFFKVGNERFGAHKSILAARCPVFLRYLSDNRHSSNEINIPDIEPKIFKAVLWSVYTGILLEEDEHECDEDDSNPFMLASFTWKMLSVADRYELKGLKTICELSISRRISGKSVAYLLHLAQLHHAKELKSACIRFVSENEAGLDVVDPDGCKYLKETYPSLFLELAYNENDPIHEHQERDLCSKIVSVVKQTFVNMVRPRQSTDKKHKIKVV